MMYTVFYLYTYYRSVFCLAGLLVSQGRTGPVGVPGQEGSVGGSVS